MSSQPLKKLVACPRCRLQNPTTATACLSCKAPLPREAPPPPAPAPPPPPPDVQGSGVVENSLMMGAPASRVEVAPSPRIVRSPTRSFDRSKAEGAAPPAAGPAPAPAPAAPPPPAPTATYAVYASQPAYPQLPATVVGYFQGAPGLVFPPGFVPPGALAAPLPPGIVAQVVPMVGAPMAPGMPVVGMPAPVAAPVVAPPPPVAAAPPPAVARPERPTQAFPAIVRATGEPLEIDPNPTRPVTTRMGRVDESVLHPPPTPVARAVSYVVARADDPRAVAWLSCDPLPPIPVGLSPVVSIGRSVTCDLVLPHSSVSRTHAVIKVEGKKLHFEDRSSYGSFVNGSRTSSAEIKPGDTITIGPYEITVKARSDSKPKGQLEDGSETRPLGAALRDLDTADAMSGRLEKQPLTEVLQSLEFNEKTGTLEVHSGGLGGKLVVFQGAPMTASFGPLEGEAAIHAMVQLTEGYYSFRKNVEAGERNIQKRITGILLDASRNADEETGL